MHVGAGKEHENVVHAEAKSLDVLGPWKIKPGRDFHRQAKGRGHSNDLFTSNCVPDINLYPGSTQRTEVGAQSMEKGHPRKGKKIRHGDTATCGYHRRGAGGHCSPGGLSGTGLGPTCHKSWAEQLVPNAVQNPAQWPSQEAGHSGCCCHGNVRST